MHGAHVCIVDIPTSISVKWELDPECPPCDISSATRTDDNEFELYRVPLGQVHGEGVGLRKGFVREGKLAGESEGVRVISKVGLTVGHCVWE